MPALLSRIASSAGHYIGYCWCDLGPYWLGYGFHGHKYVGCVTHKSSSVLSTSKTRTLGVIVPVLLESV